MKKTELRRKTPLKASRALQSKTPLKATTPLKRSSVPLKRAPIAISRPKPKLAPTQKARLVDRSGGMCEIYKPTICWGRATDVAHRIGEGMGGRHGAAAVANDQLSVVLHACRPCHEWTHRRPEAAQRMGWMLRNGSEARSERVWYGNRAWVLLGDDGSVTPCESS